MAGAGSPEAEGWRGSHRQRPGSSGLQIHELLVPTREVPNWGQESLWGWGLHQSPMAVIANYHKLGGLKEQKCIPSCSGGHSLNSVSPRWNRGVGRAALLSKALERILPPAPGGPTRSCCVAASLSSPLCPHLASFPCVSESFPPLLRTPGT